LALIAERAAWSESGRTRRALLDVHRWLQEGQPLSTALYRGVPEISAASARAIAAAEQIGRVPEELRRQLKRYLPQGEHAPDLDRFYRPYSVLTSVMLVFIMCGMLGTFVMPKMTSILAGFGHHLPWITQVIMAVCQSNVTLLIVGALAVVVCIPWRGAMRDYLVSCVPVAAGAARDHGLADLFSFLGDALESGQPMDAALLHAEQAQPNAIIRRHIRHWRNNIEAGGAVGESAGRAGLPPLVTRMLKTATSSENAQQVMSFLARHYEYRFSRFREILRAAAIPAYVTIMGALVLLVQLSVFQPMIALIDATAGAGHHHGGF
jgi:type II secretory pathway component PulF